MSSLFLHFNITNIFQCHKKINKIKETIKSSNKSFNNYSSSIHFRSKTIINTINNRISSIKTIFINDVTNDLSIWSINLTKHQSVFFKNKIFWLYLFKNWIPFLLGGYYVRWSDYLLLYFYLLYVVRWNPNYRINRKHMISQQNGGDNILYH